MVFDRPGAGFGDVLVSDCLAGDQIMPFWMPKYCAHYFKAIARALPPVIFGKPSCGDRTERGKRAWQIFGALAVAWHQQCQNPDAHFRP